MVTTAVASAVTGWKSACGLLPVPGLSLFSSSSPPLLLLLFLTMLLLSSQYSQPAAMQQVPHAPPPHYQAAPQQYQQPPTQQSSIQIPVGSALPKVVSTACIYPSQPGESRAAEHPIRNDDDGGDESPDLPPSADRVILPQELHQLHFLLSCSPALWRRSQPRPRLAPPPPTGRPGCVTLTLLISTTPLR